MLKRFLRCIHGNTVFTHLKPRFRSSCSWRSQGCFCRNLIKSNLFVINELITSRNEVLATVIFSQACVCPQGQGSGPGGVWSPIFRGVSNFSGGGGWVLQPEYGQRLAGMHPTGMHSCLN